MPKTPFNPRPIGSLPALDEHGFAPDALSYSIAQGFKVGPASRAGHGTANSVSTSHEKCRSACGTYISAQSEMLFGPVADALAVVALGLPAYTGV